MGSQEETGFEAFCGDSIFDETLLLNSPWPRFTVCFENSLLVWVPCGWLWLTLPVYIVYLFGYHKGVPIAHNNLNVFKTFFSIILCIVSAIEIYQTQSDINNGHNSRMDTEYNVVYVAGALKTITYLLSIVLIQIERSRGVISSGILWLFWLMTVLTNVVPFYTKIYLHEYNTMLVSFVLFYVSYACLLAQLFLFSFAERINRQYYKTLGENQCPETTSSFPNRMMYWWITSMVIKGYRSPLKEEDVFDLRPGDKGDTVIPKFNKNWNQELHRAKIKRSQQEELGKHNDYVSFHNSKTKTTTSVFNGHNNEKTPLVGQSSKSGFSTTKSDVDVKRTVHYRQLQVSLFKVILKTCFMDLIASNFFAAMNSLIQFLKPVLLSAFIAYTHDMEYNKAHGYQWKGYVLAVSFFVVNMVVSICNQMSFHISFAMGQRIKSALIAAVYKKSLTISHEERKHSTVGEIVNLMAVDCQRMLNIGNNLYNVWGLPLQIAIAMYMLWDLMGVATLAGICVLVLLMPVNGVISSINKKYQRQQMTLKDERIKLMSEVLNGMKVLKLNAWEPAFQEKVEAIRKKELSVLKKSAYLSAVSSFTWLLAPFLVALSTFCTYVLVSEDGYLDANTAFVALTLLNIIRFPINALPQTITYFIQLNVALVRLRNFLRREDLDKDNVIFDKDFGKAIQIKDGTFTWDTSNPRPTLSNISVDIPEGHLVAVVGQVGSGKSSLLNAMLGEMNKLRGKVTVKSSIAYVPQQAWIQNMTLRDNILFGTRGDKQKYLKVIDDCALKSDLDILPNGDSTEIGEKGINLSGGQKQRVSLARAVYSGADIYLLDDPLSAVDSHVGKHIFNKVISNKGALRGKTRVMVTHGLHWLPMVDSIIVVTDGRVSETGSYEQLVSHDGDFAQFLKQYLTTGGEITDGEDEDPEIIAIKTKMLERVDSVTSDHHSSGEELVTSGQSHKSTLSLSGHHGPSTKQRRDTKAEIILKAGKKLIEEEKAETGRVKFSVFFTYFKAIGTLPTVIFMSFFVAYTAASLYSNIWLAEWTSDDLLLNTSLSDTSRYEERNYMYLGVYGGLGVVQAVMVLCYALIAATQMIKATGILHTAMLTNIMHNPMMFFDTTPLGRIVNRFSRDVDTVDNILPQLIRSWINTFFSVLSTVIVISYTTPIFITMIIPLFILYFLIQRAYIPSSRQLKRLESTTRSPIYSNFSETISGAVSIRAYKADERFIDEAKVRVDKNQTFYFAGNSTNRWLGIRLQIVGNLLVLLAALFLAESDDVSDSMVGLAITYALSVTNSLNFMVRMTCDLETNIVSVERIKEYSETPREAVWVNPLYRPSPSWPGTGFVRFHDYRTRYRPGLDLVLKGINCVIKGGEKIGVVGRTGAGKSSLTVALFRLIESAGGTINIDGITISDIGLHDLRSKITILPQDPVLFSGSLRMNVDPVDEYSDDAIWQAIEHAHLKDFVQDLIGGLEYQCGEEGQNLSVGQRQLVCLARSLLRKTKIMILDEATAAIDMETDDLIQKTIRTEFSDCTVLTIAHRLNTILDYDRIMVLDQGRIVEMDSPSVLLANKSSVFYGLAKDANIV